MEQLCLFSDRAMKRMERKPKKVRKEPQPIDHQAITIMAMQDCMADGGWDGPETADELCAILGLI